MQTATGKRGRPPTPNPMSPAERMRAYRKRKRDAGLVNVRKWVATASDSARGHADHPMINARNLALHCIIARKIEANPELVDLARRNLEQWCDRPCVQKPDYLEEWQDILHRPWPDVARLITSMSDEATRLRSSSPLVSVLGVKERNRVYAAFKA